MDFDEKRTELFSTLNAVRVSIVRTAFIKTDKAS